MVGWKDFRGKVERKSCHFFLRRKDFQGDLAGFYLKEETFSWQKTGLSTDCG